MGWFSEQSVDVEKERVRVSLPHAREANARVPLRVLKTGGVRRHSCPSHRVGFTEELRPCALPRPRA